MPSSSRAIPTERPILNPEGVSIRHQLRWLLFYDIKTFGMSVHLSGLSEGLIEANDDVLLITHTFTPSDDFNIEISSCKTLLFFSEDHSFESFFFLLSGTTRGKALTSR